MAPTFMSAKRAARYPSRKEFTADWAGPTGWEVSFRSPRWYPCRYRLTLLSLMELDDRPDWLEAWRERPIPTIERPRRVPELQRSGRPSRGLDERGAKIATERHLSFLLDLQGHLGSVGPDRSKEGFRRYHHPVGSSQRPGEVEGRSDRDRRNQRVVGVAISGPAGKTENRHWIDSGSSSASPGHSSGAGRASAEG